jgi:hypothetical protein
MRIGVLAVAVLTVLTVASVVESVHSHDQQSSGRPLSPETLARLRDEYGSLEGYLDHVAAYYAHPLERSASTVACHNATGACDSAGVNYLCLSGQWIGAAHRCDGIDDCGDGGSDELWCEQPPLWVSTNQRAMQALTQSTCNGCACPIGEPSTVTRGNPYFESSEHAKSSPEFHNEYPPGKKCHQEHTSAIMVQLYKKTGFCRKAVCCARLIACVACSLSNVTAHPGKCWEKVLNASAPPL